MSDGRRARVGVRRGLGVRIAALQEEPPVIDPRAAHLLKTLVERYIAEGQPGLDLSPATIRNVMADLEEMGFVASPHTSAGRVPAPKGYRFFVDSLIVVQALEQVEIHRLEERLKAERPTELL